MTTLTDADKEGLSPEEIEAIESDEGDEGDDLKSADELEAELKAEEEAAAGAEEKPATDRSAEDSKHADGPAFVPLPSIDQAELDRLKTAYDDAKQKFDDGDIDFDELGEAKDAYNAVKWKADFVQESNQAIVDGVWKREQDNFLDANPEYQDNRALNAAFVAEVNRLIKTPEAANMTDRQVLQSAKETVERDLRIDESAADAAGRRSGDETGPTPGEFDYLDRLEGAAYEAAVGKLSPDQLARYEDAQ